MFSWCRWLPIIPEFWSCAMNGCARTRWRPDYVRPLARRRMPVTGLTYRVCLDRETAAERSGPVGNKGAASDSIHTECVHGWPRQIALGVPFESRAKLCLSLLPRNEFGGEKHVASQNIAEEGGLGTDASERLWLRQENRICDETDARCRFGRVTARFICSRLTCMHKLPSSCQVCCALCPTPPCPLSSAMSAQNFCQPTSRSVVINGYVLSRHALRSNVSHHDSDCTCLQPSSSSERTHKQPALHILTNDNSLSDIRSTDSMSYTSEQPAASTSRAALTDVPDVMPEPSRHSNNIPNATLAHPFPSGSSSSACRVHSRAKSTTEHIEKATASLDHRATRRARAASSATVGTRPRLPSMLASLLTHHRAPAQPRTAAHDPDLVGSFTPTSSPRPRLQSLISGLGAGSSDSFGSIGASPPQPSPPPSRFATATRSLSRHRHQSEAPRPRARAQTSARSASPSLPSICRTPSSYSGSDYFTFPTAASSTAPSSAGPATPVHTAPALPVPGGAGADAGTTRKSGDYLTLHPVLEDLERSSMFRVQTACATCGKRGSNFPTCPKCGEMWCSRACRLQKGDGKRHICAKRC